MGEKPDEELLFSPEYSILEFGDGYLALLQGGRSEINDNGIRIAVLKIKPSSLLKKRYNIKDSDLNRNGNMEYKVPQDDLIPINQYDDANRKWLYIKNFNHEETEISKQEWVLRQRLKWAEQRIYALEGQLIWMSEQLNLAKSSPSEFVTQGIDVYEKINAIIERSKNKEGDKE